MSFHSDLQKHSQEEIAWYTLQKLAGRLKGKNAPLFPHSDRAKKTKKLKPSANEDNDRLLTASVKKALRRNIDIYLADIKVRVKEGWITLSGAQNWNYQRESAEKCLNIKGIKGIINNISVRSVNNMMMAFMWENPVTL